MPEVKTRQKMSRKFKLISILIVLIILILSFLFVLKPKYDEVSQARQELASNQQEFADQKIYLDDIKKLISDYQKINSADVEKINKVLPAEEDIAGLFVQVEAMAKESGLNLLGLDIAEKGETPELAKSKIKELDITLNLAGGDYSAFKKFLSVVESNLRMMEIISINFAPEAATYALNLKTYYKE
jgi:Tfp pilus assembly protein PilO